jgi:hypothetical protein
MNAYSQRTWAVRLKGTMDIGDQATILCIWRVMHSCTILDSTRKHQVMYRTFQILAEEVKDRKFFSACPNVEADGFANLCLRRPQMCVLVLNVHTMVT